MSFLQSAFSGASNNFTPAGTAQAQQQAGTANANYAQANTGFNTLAQQLQQQASGQGPNLANAQLQSATGQNVANQAALMAGQRGASQNVGLIARQAGQQRANIQQQAAGQAAQNVAAQQINAQNQLGAVYGAQAVAANQNYGISQGAVNNNNQIGSQQAAQNASMNQGLIGGAANAGMKLLGMADGGQVPGAFDALSKGSNFGFNFTSGAKPGTKQPNPMKGAQTMAPMAGQAGSPAPMQPNPMNQAQPINVSYAANGGSTNQLPFAPMDYRKGGAVKAQAPEQKATVSGNSYENDKIPGMLSEGETVIDRDTMQDPGPAGKMARTLAKHIEAKKKGKR